MTAQSLSQRYLYGIVNQACSPQFLCIIPSIAKEITQLRKTCDNFRVWEKHLKMMIRNLTGSTTYFLYESNVINAELDKAVFNLIFWSIDESLQMDLDIDGSARDAFQVLEGRFRSNPLSQCIMGRADFPEEILDIIAEMVYYDSFYEWFYILNQKVQRIKDGQLTGPAHGLYLDQPGPPILNSIQNLAVVNRKFHRICLPYMWQKIKFPSAIPAPVSLWTEDLLLRHGHLVKLFEFELKDDCLIGTGFSPSEPKRNPRDNTVRVRSTESLDWIEKIKYGFSSRGIGLVNVQDIIKACPFLETVSLDLACISPDEGWASRVALALQRPLTSIPQLQCLKLGDRRMEGLPGEFVIDLLDNLPSLVSLTLRHFNFSHKESIEESLGWNLGKHKTLRKLHLDRVTCDDGTWTLNSWPRRFETLEFDYTRGMSPHVLQRLLNGSAPLLTSLKLSLGDLSDEPRVDFCFDLPALKCLHLQHYGTNHLLPSFEKCKSIEVILYYLNMGPDEWDTVMHHLSRYTWPKLSILEVSNSIDPKKFKDKKSPKEYVDEIWNSYKIKLDI